MLYCLGRDFHYEHTDNHWTWSGFDGQSHVLPEPALQGEHQLRNAAAVMMVLACLAESFPVSYKHIHHALANMQLAGRQQVISGKFNWLVDVAHNAQSIECLADFLRNQEAAYRTHAVVGMLKDKDITANLASLQSLVSDWYCVDLQVPRGASANDLQTRIEKSASDQIWVDCYPNVAAAMAAAEARAGAGDIMLVFGSFYTVAEALQRGV